MTLEDVSTGPVEVFPENSRAVEIFISVGTQWRIGPSGATGLDYNVLLPMLARLNLPATAYDDLFDSIRVLEAAALGEMHRH